MLNLRQYRFFARRSDNFMAHAMVTLPEKLDLTRNLFAMPYPGRQ